MRRCSRRPPRRASSSRGQTIEGTIVAFGPEGGLRQRRRQERGADRPRRAEGRRRRRRGVGRRSHSGGGRLDQRRHHAVAQGRAQCRDAARARGRLPGRARRGRQGREGREGRLRGAHRSRARLLSALADRHRPHRPTRRCTKGRSTPSASSSTRTAARTSSSRGASTSKSSSARAPRPCASRSCLARCSRAAWSRCGTSARSSTWAAASRVCFTCPK